MLQSATAIAMSQHFLSCFPNDLATSKGAPAIVKDMVERWHWESFRCIPFPSSGIWCTRDWKPRAKQDICRRHFSLSSIHLQAIRLLQHLLTDHNDILVFLVFSRNRNTNTLCHSCQELFWVAHLLSFPFQPDSLCTSRIVLACSSAKENVTSPWYVHLLWVPPANRGVSLVAWIVCLPARLGDLNLCLPQDVAEQRNLLAFINPERPYHLAYFRLSIVHIPLLLLPIKHLHSSVPSGNVQLQLLWFTATPTTTSCLSFYLQLSAHIQQSCVFPCPFQLRMILCLYLGIAGQPSAATSHLDF